MIRHQMTATVQHASSVSRLRRGGVFSSPAEGKEQGAPAPFNLSSGRRAFTVIEMVGVLTIIALLASATLPKMTRRIDRTVWEREKADQQAMPDALTASILRNKTITN